jgi:hypothetical protein
MAQDLDYLQPWIINTPLVIKVRELATSLTLPGRDLTLKAPAYAIPPESLPSYTTIDMCAAAIADSNSHAFAGSLRGSILRLARNYINCDNELPLVS